MKTRNLSLIVVGLVTLITFSTFIRGYAGQDVGHGLSARPTLAPAPPQEEVDPVWEPTAVPLAKPLETPAEILNQLAVYDAQWAEWAVPWNADTLTDEPGRITLESFPGRAEESEAMDMNEWFHPSIEANAGAVWSITIKGDVNLRMIGSGVDSPVSADGVNYALSARTGNLLAIRSGVPEKYK